jgi:hypothetical protein
MAYLHSYSKSSSIISTSKGTTEGTPMVMSIVAYLMKCKLWAVLWDLLATFHKYLLVYLPFPPPYIHIEILES